MPYKDREVRLAYGRRWNIEHAAEHRATAKRWQKSHKAERLVAQRRYRKKHPEKARAAWRRAHQKRKEIERQAQKLRYLRNLARSREKARLRYWMEPEIHRERSRRYRERNPEKFREQSRRWTANHPDSWKVAHANRKARLKSLPDTLTVFEWKHIKELFDFRCAYCEKSPTTTLTQDHVVPLVRGGGTVAWNIVPACRSCNSKKWAKSIQPSVHKRLVALIN